MVKDGKKLAIVGGITGIVGAIIYALTRKVKAAPPPPPPPGLANLYGIVTDAQTGAALSGVLVSLNEMQTFTNGSGNYVFTEIVPGEYSVSFSKEGYAAVVY